MCLEDIAVIQSSTAMFDLFPSYSTEKHFMTKLYLSDFLKGFVMHDSGYVFCAVTKLFSCTFIYNKQR